MNVLIIGNNPKHAKVFSMFADKVFLLLQRQYTGINRLSKELYDYNLLYSDIEYDTNEYILKRNLEIRKLIKLYSIDIVFSNRKDDMVQAKIATWGIKRKPLMLVTFHNSIAWADDTKARLMSVMIKCFCDGCICLARFMYEKLIHYGVKKTKLLYLPNTIQFENYKVKDDYSLYDNKVRICFTAVIYPLKNQEIIVNTINALKYKYNFEVHLYGDYIDKDYYQKLKSMIKDCGLENIVFLDGQVDNDEIREILPQCDIYLSSTTIEMSPYNILEAKASALPILASRVLGQKDLIDDGVDGILYDINDQKDLIIKLDCLISDIDLRKRLGLNARKSVSTSKSYLEASKKLKAFIDDLSHDRRISE